MTARYTVHTGDCRDVLRDYPADHFDSIVSDPPYGLTFMGKGWDRGVPGVEFWQEALRVAKPGAHLLAFGGTRTFHRLTVAIEDAGWEVRDCMMWLYATGFPKSHNGPWGGTALKPAWEPVIVARKPLSGTVADNVLRYGTGALNIDGCRIAFDGVVKHTARKSDGVADHVNPSGWQEVNRTANRPATPLAIGRWPANVLHDGSDEVVAGFPVTGAAQASMRGDRTGVVTDFGGGDTLRGHNDAGGSAARFFYCAKASRTDRDEGCDHLPGFQGHEVVDRKEGSAGLNSPRAGAGRTISNVREFGGAQHTEDVKLAKNFHPTVKPTDLMRYLCRLVTPPDGLVLDPFCGSGSTGKAALLEGLRFVGVDLDPAHVAIAEARCQFAVDTVAEQAAAAEAPGAQLALF
jgi:site-specific DNA-methyltransferase (adenine-specific)